MNDNLAIFLVMTISIVGAVTLTAVTGWLKMNTKIRVAAAAGGAAVEPRVEKLTDENAALRGELSRLHERLAVLERIATDPAERTAREIESLR